MGHQAVEPTQRQLLSMSDSWLVVKHLVEGLWQSLEVEEPFEEASEVNKTFWIDTLG